MFLVEKLMKSSCEDLEDSESAIIAKNKELAVIKNYIEALEGFIGDPTAISVMRNRVEFI